MVGDVGVLIPTGSACTGNPAKGSKPCKGEYPGKKTELVITGFLCCVNL